MICNNSYIKSNLHTQYALPSFSGITRVHLMQFNKLYFHIPSAVKIIGLEYL